MLPLLFLAWLPTVLSSAAVAVADSDASVRSSANGEFISRHYPPGAYKRGEQGRVGFRLTIEPDGSLGTCDVTESSGFATLDKETCEVMLRYASFTPVHNADGRAIRTVRPGYIVWKLRDGAPQLATTDAVTMPKPEQVLCKRTPTTGSLIQRTKQCMTRVEWARNRRQNQDTIDEIQGKGHFDCNSIPGAVC